jgi:hypothetical protein
MSPTPPPKHPATRALRPLALAAALCAAAGLLFALAATQYALGIPFTSTAPASPGGLELFKTFFQSGRGLGLLQNALVFRLGAAVPAAGCGFALYRLGLRLGQPQWLTRLCWLALLLPPPGLALMALHLREAAVFSQPLVARLLLTGCAAAGKAGLAALCCQGAAARPGGGKGPGAWPGLLVFLLAESVPLLEAQPYTPVLSPLTAAALETPPRLHPSNPANRPAPGGGGFPA